MIVNDLIEALEQLDGDAEVLFSYNYGDHWHTQVASEIRKVEEGNVVHSDYHGMDRVIDEDSSDMSKSRLVVILS